MSPRSSTPSQKRAPAQKRAPTRKKRSSLPHRRPASSSKPPTQMKTQMQTQTLSKKNENFISHLRHALERHDNEPLLYSFDQSQASLTHLTSHEVLDRMDEMALGLQKLGVKPREHVGVMGISSIDAFIFTQAVICLGAISVHIPEDIDVFSLQKLPKEMKFKIIYTDSELSCDMLTAIQKNLKTVILTESLAQLSVKRKNFISTKVMSLDKLIALGSSRLSRHQKSLQETIKRLKDSDAAVTFYTRTLVEKTKNVTLTQGDLSLQLDKLSHVQEFAPDKKNRILITEPLTRLLEYIHASLFLTKGIPLCLISQQEDQRLKNERRRQELRRIQDDRRIQELQRIKNERRFQRIRRLQGERRLQNTHPIQDELSYGLIFKQAIHAFSPSIITAVPYTIKIIYELILKDVDQKKTLINFITRHLGRPFWLPPEDEESKLPDAEDIEKYVASRKMQRIIGRNLHTVICSEAKIDPKILSFFSKLNVPIYESYTLTDVGSIIAYSDAQNFMPKSAGKVLDHISVKISEEKEILIHSPIFHRKNSQISETTKSKLISDKQKRLWLPTGDIGKVKNGYIFIEGRLHDFGRTATGHFFNPYEIENRINEHPLIDGSIILSRAQDEICVLIFMNSFYLSRKNRGKPSFMTQQMTDWITHVNEDLKPWEAIARIKIIWEQPFFAHQDQSGSENDKRRELLKQFEKEIDELYAQT